ncbi:MAG TPA: regulatory protein GemA [Methylococcus sp.]|nr:regulatory protein GemA [Methylococcus sp.]
MISKTMERRVLLGLAHKGAKLLGWDEDFRREMQQRITGHASCRDMSDAELKRWCWHLKALGADIGIPGPPLRGGRRMDRPTPWQLGEIERLALAFGWEGLDDRRLLGFVRHTAHVDDVRFLTRRQASAVIVGLGRWLCQREGAA